LFDLVIREDLLNDVCLLLLFEKPTASLALKVGEPQTLNI